MTRLPQSCAAFLSIVNEERQSRSHDDCHKARRPPAVVLASFTGKGYVLSGISLLITMLTGFSSFFPWKRIWYGNSNAQMAIEQHRAKWEFLTYIR